MPKAAHQVRSYTRWCLKKLDCGVCHHVVAQSALKTKEGFATNIIFAHLICLNGTSKNGNHLEGWDILILMH